MMNKIALIAFLALLIISPDAAFARSKSAHAKSSGSYIEKSCKTNACFKKHPGGRYGFESGSKRK